MIKRKTTKNLVIIAPKTINRNLLSSLFNPFLIEKYPIIKFVKAMQIA
jgi:hypothetical protein